MLYHKLNRRDVECFLSSYVVNTTISLTANLIFKMTYRRYKGMTEGETELVNVTVPFSERRAK